MSHSLRRAVALVSLLAGLSARELLFPTGAMAACTPAPAANTTTTCNTTTLTNTLGSGPGGPDNSTIVIQSGASVTAGNFSAISLRDGATITLQNNSTVTNNASSGGGLYGAGRDTIEFRSFGTLMIGEGATLSSLGSANTAEAVNLMGQGNTVINRGTISAVNTAAIWFEDQVIGAANTPIPLTISASSGAAAGPNRSPKTVSAARLTATSTSSTAPARSSMAACPSPAATTR
jgi:fibronectin-binding autotransporter adhesin